MRPLPRMPVLVLAAALALGACDGGEAPLAPAPESSPGASLQARDNTLLICHVTGRAGYRMMSIDPQSEADHLGHGDWHPLQAFIDADGDGWGSTEAVLVCELAPGVVTNDDDCDDAHADSHPGATEIVGDHRDNDCDGLVDESWSAWGAAATGAARNAARLWLGSAAVVNDRCHVNALTATGGPGVVAGPSVAGRVKIALLDAGAPSDVAQHWDDAFAAAWAGWAGAITIPALPWYPALAAWPGPSAPPTPNVPTALAGLASIGAPGMAPSALRSSVATAIGGQAAAADASAAIGAFADDVGGRFALTLTRSVTNVLGYGPVPTYAPPAVPLGPVVGGHCFGGDFPTAGW